jgi:hypothetical protein
MKSDDDAANVRLNEVMGTREAGDLTECKAGTVNSAPMGQRCQRCEGRKFVPPHLFSSAAIECPRCHGTGREPHI